MSLFSAPISEDFNSFHGTSVCSDFPPSTHHTNVASPLRSPAPSVASLAQRKNSKNSAAPSHSEIQASLSYGSDFESAPASVHASSNRGTQKAWPLHALPSQTKSYGSDFESDDDASEKIPNPGSMTESSAAAERSRSVSASLSSHDPPKKLQKSSHSNHQTALAVSVSSSSAGHSGARTVVKADGGSGGNASAPHVEETISFGARSGGTRFSRTSTGAVNGEPLSDRDARSLTTSLCDRPSTGSVSVMPCSTPMAYNTTPTSSRAPNLNISGITTDTINTVPHNSISDGYVVSSSHLSARSSRDLQSGALSSLQPSPTASIPGSSKAPLYRQPSSSNSIRSVGSSDASPVYSFRSGSSKRVKTSDAGTGVGNALFPLLEGAEVDSERVYVNPCRGDLPMSNAVLTKTARAWQLVFEKLHKRKVEAVAAEDYIEAQDSVKAMQTLKAAKQAFTGRHGGLAGKWSWLRQEFKMALESEEFSYCCELKELRARILEEFHFLKNEEQIYLANLMKTDIRRPPRPGNNSSGSPCCTTSSVAPTPRPQKGRQTKAPLADDAPYFPPFDTSLPQSRGASPYFSINYKATPRTSRSAALQKAAFRFAASAAVQTRAKTKSARAVLFQCAQMNKKCTDAVAKLEQWQTRVDERLDDLLVATLSPQRTKKQEQTTRGEQDQQPTQSEKNNAKDLLAEREEENVGTGQSGVREAQDLVVLQDTRQKSAAPTAAESCCVRSKQVSRPRILESKRQYKTRVLESKPKVTASLAQPKAAFADTNAAKAVSSRQEPKSQPQHFTNNVVNQQKKVAALLAQPKPTFADTNASKTASSEQEPKSQPLHCSANNVVIQQKVAQKNNPSMTVSRPLIPPAIEWSKRFDEFPQVPQLPESSPQRSSPQAESKQPPICSPKQLSPRSVGTSAYDYSADIAKFKPRNSISASASKATPKVASTVTALPPVSVAVPKAPVTAKKVTTPSAPSAPSAPTSRPPTPRRDEWDEDFIVNPMASDADTLIQSLKASGIWVCLWHNSTKSPETILERPPPRFITSCLRALGAPSHDIDQYDASGRERFFHGVLQCASLGVNLLEQTPLLFPRPKDVTKGLQSAKCRRVLQSILQISKMSTELPAESEWISRFPTVDSTRLSFEKVVEHTLEVNNPSAEFLDGVRQILHVGGWVNYVRGLLWFRSEADQTFELDPSFFVPPLSGAAREDTCAPVASVLAQPAGENAAAHAPDNVVCLDSSSPTVEAGEAAVNAIADTKTGRTTLSAANGAGAREETLLPPGAKDVDDESIGVHDVIMDTATASVTVTTGEVSVMIEASPMTEVLVCGEDMRRVDEDYGKADSDIFKQDGDVEDSIDAISSKGVGGGKDIAKEEEEKSMDDQYDVAFEVVSEAISYSVQGNSARSIESVSDMAPASAQELKKTDANKSVDDDYDVAFETLSELADDAAAGNALHTIDDTPGSGGAKVIMKHEQDQMVNDNYDGDFEFSSGITSDSITGALNNLPPEKEPGGSDSQIAEVLSSHHTAGKPPNFDCEESIHSLDNVEQKYSGTVTQGTTTPHVTEPLVRHHHKSAKTSLTECNLRARHRPGSSYSVNRDDDSEEILGESRSAFEEESLLSVETLPYDLPMASILEDSASNEQDSIMDLSDYEHIGAESFRERFGASDEVATGSAKKQRPLSAMGGRKSVGESSSMGFSNVPGKSPFLEVESHLPDDDRREEKKKKKAKKEKKTKTEHVSSSILYRPSNVLQPFESARHARHATTPSTILKPLEPKDQKKKKKHGTILTFD